MGLPASVAFALMALLLLAGTLAWHLPMMLWDHIDLVPMYEAWREGTLASSEFWRIHDGSHLHVAAYAVLLFTTWASNGQPWLDCLASLVLLCTQAWILVGLAHRTLGDRARGVWMLALVFIALHPGHLVNLQWGWQVAVFISTLGAVAAIALLTRATLSLTTSMLAAGLAFVGVLGFSTTLAVFPIAMGLIALHPAIDRRTRVLCTLPWLLAGGILLWWLANGRDGGAVALPGMGTLAMYVLNYLGSGVSRLATGVAPVWAAIALATAGWVAFRHWRVALLPWLALMLFGVGCAVLTALGRAEAYGADHAFVTRYLSFSSLFWFGWVGLMLSARRDAPVAWRRWVRPLLGVLLVFLLANGLHMTKQARELHARGVAFATHIREYYPAVDGAIMEAAYGWRAAEAHGRLGQLRARGFAPFHGDEVPATDAP